MAAADLWPDFPIDPKPRGVRQILREAGAGLKENTNGLIEFRVFPRGDVRDGTYLFDCELVLLDLDYTFLLLRVKGSPTGFPLEVISESSPPVVVKDGQQLLAVLSGLFLSDRTHQIVQNLISMATA
ncbi:MAG: hypothetical protein JWO38_5303 [Gemmataceae bacterium]|nr:hypothetical protein [Gemmataceae bacterium]